jgi:hypothetical protein
MKHISNFNSFLNEDTDSTSPININYYAEVLDNWGRQESSEKPENIIAVLKDPENFSDDMTFIDVHNKQYSVDDLIGKEVKVGSEIFMVNETENINQAKTFTVADLTKEWDVMYGEDLKTEYSALYDELAKLKSFELEDVVNSWDKFYGEDFKEEYSGLYKKLSK